MLAPTEAKGNFSGPVTATEMTKDKEIRLIRKIDFRLCTIAMLLVSLDLLDSNIISSAAVTSMLHDLGLDVGNRFSLSIFIWSLAGVAFQLPSTIVMRIIGPRIFFTAICFTFGLLTLVRSLSGHQMAFSPPTSARRSSVHGKR